MRGKWLVLCAVLISIVAVSVPIQGQDGNAVVAAVVKAMGAENLKTLEFTASGSNAGIGQNIDPAAGWPMVPVKSYTRQIDLDAAASGVQAIRVQNNADAPMNQVIRRETPWSQQYDLWITPYAFLKGAMTNPVTVRPAVLQGDKYTVISYTLENKYRIEGYINDKNLVEKVRTWVENDVLGDMPVEAVYRDYQSFGGLQVPTLMIVKQGGSPTTILVVSDAKANVPVNIPPAPAPAAVAPVTVLSEKIADGVYYLRGGTHHSVLVEFADHLTLIEAPQNEARSLALLAEIRKLYPNKPLTEVVNTHHHFDHAGGLRTFVDAGATIITHENNKAFYEQAFAAPRTISPDRLEQSKKKTNIVTVGDKKVLSDATRTLELYLIKDNTHDDGILMAFLPKEKILVEADLYTPPAANAPAPAANAPVNPNAATLLTDLETLRLDFDTVLPLHGPGKATRADLYAFVHKPYVPVSALPGARGAAATASVAIPTGPDAELATLVNTACTTCHSAARINNKKADRDGWAATVDRMKGKGAELTDEQVPRLVDYLARVHGQ